MKKYIAQGLTYYKTSKLKRILYMARDECQLRKEWPTPADKVA